ncbi:Hypothetical protein NTJ_05245 [Nesidiocoris tenuis]|uniref:Uncharacterized protein n=1 Tax=Nesidiocoris tenuis TaxID=355587 RepID=A0ABN7ALX8_9HEMI|nr:Hypothetical protein NTJ_05245 [Nesidiocoris tenuis]
MVRAEMASKLSESVSPATCSDVTSSHRSSSSNFGSPVVCGRKFDFEIRGSPVKLDIQSTRSSYELMSS